MVGRFSGRGMEAFWSRQVRRHSKDVIVNGETWAELVPITDWFSVEFDRTAIASNIRFNVVKPHELTRHEYPDLQSFFNAIGWDRKKKKFAVPLA